MHRWRSGGGTYGFHPPHNAWRLKGVGLGLVLAGCLGLVVGAWILFRDRRRLGTMRFLDHERTFDMPRSDFDEVYSATQQLQATLLVTMTELKESIDDVEPDSVFERVSAAVHVLLAILCDPNAEHFVWAAKAGMRLARTKNVHDVEEGSDREREVSVV